MNLIFDWNIFKYWTILFTILMRQRCLSLNLHPLFQISPHTSQLNPTIHLIFYTNLLFYVLLLFKSCSPVVGFSRDPSLHKFFKTESILSSLPFSWILRYFRLLYYINWVYYNISFLFIHGTMFESIKFVDGFSSSNQRFPK